MSQDLPARTRLTLAAQNKSVVSIAITASDSEEHFAFDREDFTEETMALANAQAVGTTEEAKNRYGLTIGGQIKSLQVNGYPAKLENDGPGGRNTYSDEFSQAPLADAKIAFEETSNTKTLGLNVIKGRALPATELDIDYMQLLREIEESPNDNRLTTAIEKNAEENNGGFSSRKQYLTIGQREQDTSIGKVVLQNEFGVYAPKNSDESRVAVELKLQTLKNLGLQMMLKSSGEFASLTDEDNYEQVLLAKAGSMAPGLARMGTKIPLSNLQPSNMVREANPDFIQNDSSLLKQDDILTHGSYNSPLVPFDGIDSRSSVAASSILIATLSLLFEVLSRAFDPKNGLQSPLFNSITNQVNRIVTPTKNDYTECVRKGLAIFFGNGSDNFGSLVGSGFGRLNESPGYYNTILRNLVRSLTYEFGQALFAAAVPPGIIDGIVGPLETDSAVSMKPAGLSLDIGSNIIKAFAQISQSKVVGFMNVLANIGDIAISLEENNLLRSDGSVIGSDSIIADTIESDSGGGSILNPASLVYRNRLSNEATQEVMQIAGGKNHLAWGASTTPSKYILPNSIIVGADDLGGAGTGRSLVAKLSTERGFEEAEARISPDMVTAMEDELDASYVPFYFHDLRTNEIVSFHAFLTEMTDGFTAEYGETSGYGRIGKVYTYKNTDRSISLGFIVAATNDTDFQRMWWKINKLITTVYPQYTAGRALKYQGEKFIQPFSQLPSASPLVRIRLGDVWKSNYSKFGLARLFGLGQGQDKFALNQGTINSERQSIQAYRNTLDEVRRRMAGNDFSVNERFYFQYSAPAAQGRQARRVQPGMPFGAPEDSYVLHQVPVEGVTGTPTPSPRGSSQRPESQPLTSGRYLLRVVEKTSGNSGTVSVASAPSSGEPQASSNTTLYKVQIDDSPSGTRSTQYYIRLPNATDSQAVVPPQAAMVTLYDPDIEAAARSRTAASGSVDGTSQEQQNTTSLVQNFFNSSGENSNPVFKAFESTKGKGLAGFIKAIKFDWNESVWSVDGYNGKAPTMLKVAIDFAPIHDIAPGLDNNGFNTGPVYRVGEVSDALNTSVHEDKSADTARREKYNTFTRAVRRKD